MSPAKSGGSSGIQWWQILILVLAALVVLWRVGAYTMQVRREHDAKVVAGTEKNPAKPGTKTHQMFEEK